MDNLNPENLTPEQEIRKAEAQQGTELEVATDSHFNPYKNSDVISIIRQKDGNYKCFGQKNGKLIEIRAIKPEDALGEFLIHG